LVTFLRLLGRLQLAQSFFPAPFHLVGQAHQRDEPRLGWFNDFRLRACQRDLSGLPIRWTPELRDRVDATRRRAEWISESSVIKAVDK